MDIQLFSLSRAARFAPWRALLFVLFLCLGCPLVAKCPAYSVKIRGKVECSFKPDDKILASLIFYHDQPEGSGVEAAMDIHNGTFDGRIAFDTYSSSFLSEDRCHRKPKSILIRLVEADGLEQDRMLLKIKDAFDYSEQLGSYTPKSDLVLHGWCQPQCCGASLPRQADWHKVDAGPFSIMAPPGWAFHQLQGVDSYVGEFVGDGITLTFDFGHYSDGYLKRAKKPAYVVAHEVVGGSRAKIASPKTPGHGITGIYFRHAGGSDGLCVFARDLTSSQQALALKIFETIRFGGPVPRYVLPPPPPAKDER